MEAPPGFEPGMEVLQTSALPLGYGAALMLGTCGASVSRDARALHWPGTLGWLVIRSRDRSERQAKDGAGNGIRTRDFDLGKVALYH